MREQQEDTLLFCRLRRPPAWAKSRIKAESSAIAPCSGHCAKGRPPGHAPAKGLNRCIRHRLIHPARSLSGERHWGGIHQHAALSLSTPTKTGLQPIFLAIHSTRSQGIAVDVAQHRHEMIVLLNRKRLESPLPHRTPRPMVVMRPAHSLNYCLEIGVHYTSPSAIPAQP